MYKGTLALTMTVTEKRAAQAPVTEAKKFASETLEKVAKFIPDLKKANEDLDGSECMENVAEGEAHIQMNIAVVEEKGPLVEEVDQDTENGPEEKSEDAEEEVEGEESEQDEEEGSEEEKEEKAPLSKKAKKAEASSEEEPLAEEEDEESSYEEESPYEEDDESEFSEEDDE